VRERIGNEPLRQVTKGHIVSGMLTGLKPFARNGWIKTLRSLYRFAIEAGFVDADPTAGIKKTEASLAGTMHTWSEAEVAQFEARHGVGTAARLAFALLLYSAQRASDVVRIGPQHVRDGFLFVRQQKTKMARQDRELRIPGHPELRRVIDATPTGQLAFLVTRYGVPFTAKGFSIRFSEWCKQAGLPDGCTAHGLRKTACVRLVQAGCSISEVMAISGHRNMAQVKTYIEKVDQQRLAETAMAPLV